MTMSRRYQLLSPAAWCETCADALRVSTYGTAAERQASAEASASRHASMVGHTVRVLESRLIIITPAEVPGG